MARSSLERRSRKRVTERRKTLGDDDSGVVGGSVDGAAPRKTRFSRKIPGAAVDTSRRFGRTAGEAEAGCDAGGGMPAFMRSGCDHCIWDRLGRSGGGRKPTRGGIVDGEREGRDSERVAGQIREPKMVPGLTMDGIVHLLATLERQSCIDGGARIRKLTTGLFRASLIIKGFRYVCALFENIFENIYSRIIRSSRCAIALIIILSLMSRPD